MYVDFCFPLEPAGGKEQKSAREQKSANIEWKMVTLIHPYPNQSKVFKSVK
jgi:hypothetical protein